MTDKPIKGISRGTCLFVAPLLLLFFFQCSATAQLTCSDCAGCNAQILTATPGQSVTLTADITGQSGSCIDFDGTSGVTGVIFDCGGNIITGEGSGNGIDIHDSSDNNMVRNCPGVKGFSRGISIDSSTGNTLQNSGFSGNSYAGVYLRYANSNTLTKVMANSSYNANGHGIHLYHSDSNDLSDIDASYNERNGIFLEYSNWNTISDLRAYRNDEKGIYISWTSRDNTLGDSDITTMGYSAGLYVYGYLSARNDIDTSNVVDGKPVLFYDGTYKPCPGSQAINPGDQYSQISAYGCSGMTINGADINDGLFLWYVSDSYLYNIESSGNIMGIESWRVDRTEFRNITVIGNEKAGIYHRYGDSNTYTNILSSGNGIGFDISNSVGSTFSNVTASWNSEQGFTARYASSMTVDGSRFLNNGMTGVEIVLGSNYNTLRGSYIANNEMLGLSVSGWSGVFPLGNSFYDNYLSNNWNVNISGAATVTFDSSMDCGLNNVMGCICTGGNFWAHPNGSGFSLTCTDSDSDGFCDSGYMESFDSATLTDSLPLADAPGGCCDTADRDGDGFSWEQCGGTDCNDDPSEFGEACHPGAEEICDNLDNDCDSYKDEDNACMGKLRRLEERYPQPIEETACAEDSSTNLIYCFGGINVTSTGNPQTDSIVEFSPSSGAAQLVGTRLPTRRDGMSCVEDSSTNLIYCFGGYWQEFTCTQWESWGCVGGYTTPHHYRDIIEFNPSSGSLTVLPVQIPTGCGTEELSCAEDSSTNLIYCFGGDSPDSDRIFSFNPSLGTVGVVSSQLPGQRRAMSCVEDSLMNHIYCFGGITEFGATDEILEYNPASDLLVTLPEKLKSRNSYLSCAEDSSTNLIYCFSGSFPRVSVYDPDSESLDHKDAGFIFPREKMACSEDSSSNRLYCFGGWVSASLRYDDIYEYIPETSHESCINDQDCTSPEICCLGLCIMPPECPPCDDNDPCTTDSCTGSGTCLPSCLNLPITDCQDGDGCCPDTCTWDDDSDCDNLAGWWSFDSEDISGDQALDISDWGNDGTIHGASPGPGRLWESLYFSGSDEHVMTPSAAPYQFGTETGYTVQAWVRMLGTSKDTQGIVSSYDPAGSGPGFSLQYSDEQGSVRMLLTPDGSDTCMIDGATDIEDGLWHHVAAVVRRRDSCTTDDILLFINGVQETTSVASSSADTASSQDMANPLEMGSIGLGTSAFLNGSLDNVMIWNRSFSSYQIGEIYDSFFLPEDDNPRDGCIDKNELLAAIYKWKVDSTTYPMYWIMGIVTMWIRGFGCTD